MTFPWLDAARARARQPPAAPRAPLRVRTRSGLATIGSIDRGLGGRLVAAGLPLRAVAASANDGEAGWTVEGDVACSLDAIADHLFMSGVCAHRRHERLAVAAIDDTGGDARSEVYGAIERGVVRALGIATTAVHLVGTTPRAEVWVQQRAFDKATDPGLWDTLMGGQVAAGETLADTLARETMEEAGLDIAVLRDVRAAAPIAIRRPVREGYMVEGVGVRHAVVPDGVEPVNRDGEVVAFARLAPAALAARLAAGDFTLEATLILGEYLSIRRDA